MNTTDTAIDLLYESAPEPRRGRLRRRLLTGLVAVAISLAALVAGGAIYEAIASRSDTTAVPANGRLIDVDGHRLYLECAGSGGPTVVLDAGLSGSSQDWLLVRSRLSPSARVCTFDRAGMGWSEPGPLPRSPHRNADELHRLLTTAGVEGPYVLVGHSLAGKTLRMFAAAYPRDVAGMVLVDARSERIDLDATPEAFDGMTGAIRLQSTLLALARPIGLVRLLGAQLAASPNLNEDQARDLMLRQSEPNAVAATIDEGLARSDDDATLAGLRLGDLPLVVLAAGETMLHSPGWPEAQAGLASLSTRGRLVIAEHSSHAIQIDEPNAVIDAVLSVLADARKAKGE